MNLHKLADIEESEIDALFREALRPYAQAQPKENSWEVLCSRLKNSPPKCQSRLMRYWLTVARSLIGQSNHWEYDYQDPAWDRFSPAVTMVIHRMMALRLVA